MQQKNEAKKNSTKRKSLKKWTKNKNLYFI